MLLNECVRDKTSDAFAPKFSKEDSIVHNLKRESSEFKKVSWEKLLINNKLMS
jgi:hypothetical protein